jgi:hypothetical protein
MVGQAAVVALWYRDYRFGILIMCCHDMICLPTVAFVAWKAFSCMQGEIDSSIKKKKINKKNHRSKLWMTRGPFCQPFGLRKLARAKHQIKSKNGSLARQK